MRLLIVEDDVDLSNALARGFREEGYAVDQAFDGPDGLYLARTGDHDLVVLDLMLPGTDGFRIVEILRAEGHRVPIVFLTARSEVEDRVRGLRLGGDDYVVKPFSFEELLARVQAVLRRTHGEATNVLTWGPLRMEVDIHRVFWGNEEVRLTPREFRILEALLLHRGRPLSRTRLSLHVYDHAFDNESNVIDVHVANIRRKFREIAGVPVIETVRGVGFRVPESSA